MDKIKITNKRFKNERKCISSYHYLSIEKAMLSLVFYELGYGGKLIDITNSKIEICTEFLKNKDITIFEGSEDKIKMLATATYMHNELLNKTNDKEIDYLLEMEGMNKLILSNIAGMLMGGYLSNKELLKIIICFCLGLTEQQTKFCLSFKKEFLWFEAIEALKSGVSQDDIKSILI